MATCAWMRPTGLSPLARGNRGGDEKRLGAEGSIPACAGEPPSSTDTSTLGRVYPRLRGGTERDRWMADQEWGLSPLARGNRRSGALAQSRCGSIPACAGEPLAAAAGASGLGVYPRLRGGTKRSRLRPAMAYGLSPLARGNPLGAAALDGQHGSIPACAGEPCPAPAHCALGRVYPRLRGGTTSQRGINLIKEGLSPLARGNPAGQQDFTDALGSIPACAGEP